MLAGKGSHRRLAITRFEDGWESVTRQEARAALQMYYSAGSQSRSCCRDNRHDTHTFVDTEHPHFCRKSISQ